MLIPTVLSFRTPCSSSFYSICSDDWYLRVSQGLFNLPQSSLLASLFTGMSLSENGTLPRSNTNACCSKGKLAFCNPSHTELSFAFCVLKIPKFLSKDEGNSTSHQLQYQVFFTFISLVMVTHLCDRHASAWRRKETIFQWKTRKVLRI